MRHNSEGVMSYIDIDSLLTMSILFEYITAGSFLNIRGAEVDRFSF